MRIGTLGLVICVLATASSGPGPCGLLPGGRLSGDGAPAPRDWSFLGEGRPCQLELRPADPYSINLNCVARDGGLYVSSLAGARKRWTALVEEQPDVRVRIDGVVYALRARRIHDVEERRRVLAPEGGEPSEGTWLYRLEPRPGRDGAQLRRGPRPEAS